MCSPPSSPNLFLDGCSTIDDYDVCELDFIDPMTDHNQAADSFESAADEFLCSCLPPPPSNDLASSDLLIHSEKGIGNWQPSVQLEESIISSSTEDINRNWNQLGFSFDNKRNSPFVEWKSINPNLPRLCKPQNYSSLQKRCIRFLNVINNHKILGPLSCNENSSGNSSMQAVTNKTYDKLAIHHVVAERKRRAKMSDVFSALRALVPVNPKNASRATVLENTKDYVIHLQKSVQQLEQRNRELEAALLCLKSLSDRSSMSYDLLS